MVEICLEYVEDRAEKIYIYCSFEGGVQSCNFFYKVNCKGDSPANYYWEVTDKQGVKYIYGGDGAVVVYSQKDQIALSDSRFNLSFYGN